MAGAIVSIYSDNGTNFIGARNELNDLGVLLSDDKHVRRVTDFASAEKMQWHFIPPQAPHFGGLWEAAVKSAKYHLRRVIGETKLTFEEFYTILVQVESCMNSRPLCPMSSDPRDLSPLTPGHFLIGEPMTAVPHREIFEIPTNRLTRYEHVQYMFQHF